MPIRGSKDDTHALILLDPRESAPCPPPLLRFDKPQTRLIASLTPVAMRTRSELFVGAAGKQCALGVQGGRGQIPGSASMVVMLVAARPMTRCQRRILGSECALLQASPNNVRCRRVVRLPAASRE